MKTNKNLSMSDIQTVDVPSDVDTQEEEMTAEVFAKTEWIVDEELTKAHKPLVIRGQEVQVVFYTNGAVRFGVDRPSKEFKTLIQDTACKGFVNALGYVMDNKENDRYNVLVRGAHLKFNLDDDLDFEYKQDVGYLRMKSLRDQQVVKFIADNGIAPEGGWTKENSKKWYVLHVVDEELVLGHALKGRRNTAEHPELREYAKQVLHKAAVADAKKNGLPTENIPVPEPNKVQMQGFIEANKKTYQQLALHKGIEYVFDILAGARTVTVFLYGGKPKAGFEVQQDFMMTRIERLWGKLEERETARKEGAAAAIEHRKTRMGGARLDSGVAPRLEKIVNATVSGGIKVLVLRGGKTVEVDVTPEDLVKAQMYTVSKETGDRVGTDPFFRTPQEARYGVTRITGDGKRIVVRKFAS